MDTASIRYGMKVRASDGENLGKLVARGQGRFVIEKGFLFPKDYVVLDEQIASIEGDEVWLSDTSDHLREISDEEDAALEPLGEEEEEQENIPVVTSAPAQPAARERSEATRDEARVPVAEEKLEAEKHEREVGEVRVHKDVVTEERELEVPVRHEQVRVERVPVSGEAPEASFRESETRIPLHEEEVEVTKRPVMREEVRVSKGEAEEEEHIQEKARKEQVEVEERGKVRKGK